MEFKGKYYYLNNDFPCEIRIVITTDMLKGLKEDVFLTYPSVRNAYQAEKVLYSELSFESKEKLLKDLTLVTPKEARQMGRGLPIDIAGWERDKEKILTDLVAKKFEQNRYLAVELINENDENIFASKNMLFGRDNNLLGKILKRTRAEIIQKRNSTKTNSFVSRTVEDGKCIIVKRTVFEQDNIVYNYTEFINEDKDNKTVCITKWDKREEDLTGQVFYEEKRAIFNQDVDYDYVAEKFEEMSERLLEEDYELIESPL